MSNKPTRLDSFLYEITSLRFYTGFLIPVVLQLTLYLAATYYLNKGVIWFFADDIRAIAEEKNNEPK